MKYEDVLAACLERMRRGEAIDALVAEHPAFADQLRADLGAAGSLRAAASALPATTEAARARFAGELRAQRGAVAARVKQRRGWFRWRLALPALAATAAALLVAAVLVSGVVAPTDTAEASIEGVIVENDGSTMTLQTETGLQTVSIDEARLTGDDQGSLAGPGSLEPGQLILIRGTRAAASVVAERITLRAYGEMRNWCDRYPAQCAEVEKALSQRADNCAQNEILCQHIRDRLQQIRSEIASRRKLGDLRSGCEQGTAAACRELQDRCTSERPACAAIKDFLHNRQR
jgi:hypothetical protein